MKKHLKKRVQKKLLTRKYPYVILYGQRKTLFFYAQKTKGYENLIHNIIGGGKPCA